MKPYRSTECLRCCHVTVVVRETSMRLQIGGPAVARRYACDNNLISVAKDTI